MKVKLALVLSLLAAGTVLATTFTYRCPQCKLIQTYSWPGVYKCPNDGTVMWRQH
ncbi:MAG: hypothetical protein ACK5LK_00615 [Chthoniobacterales bacterium]